MPAAHTASPVVFWIPLLWIAGWLAASLFCRKLRGKPIFYARLPCPMHGHECHQGLFARNLYLGERIPLAGVAHQNGTIRFGTDPEASALDRNCKAHD